MKSSGIVTIVALVAIGVGGFFLGRWTNESTLDDLAERNRQLAQMDTIRVKELGESRTAYSLLVMDYNSEKEAWNYAKDSLNDVVGALVRKARDDGRQIETLATVNTQLVDSITVMASNISVTDTMVSAEFYDNKSYQDGSINAEGYVTIWTPIDDEPRGSASLYYDVRMTPTVLISRNDEGLAECDVSFGDMPVYVSRIRCVNNWDVDLPTRNEITLPGILTGSAITVGALGLIALLIN